MSAFLKITLIKIQDYQISRIHQNLAIAVEEDLLKSLKITRILIDKCYLLSYPICNVKCFTRLSK